MCSQNRQKKIKCKSKTYTDTITNKLLKIVTNHYHAAGNEIAKTITSFKRRAVETQETLAQARIADTHQLSLGALGQLPTQNAIRLVVKRARMEVNAAPAHFLVRSLFELGKNYLFYGKNN